MVHVEEFHGEIVTHLHAVAVFDDMYGELWQLRELGVALQDEILGELGGVDVWVAQFLLEIGNGTHMVHVSVHEDESADAVEFPVEVADIRNDEVDARHGLIRELDADIKDENVVFVFEHVAVLADFAQTASAATFGVLSPAVSPEFFGCADAAGMHLCGAEVCADSEFLARHAHAAVAAAFAACIAGFVVIAGTRSRALRMLCMRMRGLGMLRPRSLWLLRARTLPGVAVISAARDGITAAGVICAGDWFPFSVALTQALPAVVPWLPVRGPSPGRKPGALLLLSSFCVMRSVSLLRELIRRIGREDLVSTLGSPSRASV